MRIRNIPIPQDAKKNVKHTGTQLATIDNSANSQRFRLDNTNYLLRSIA